MARKSHYKKNLDKNDKKPAIFLKKSRKGLSTIVITVIIIALSLVAVVLVWGFVKNMIEKQIGSSEACFGNTEKITINEMYTCYEEISSSNFKLRFSLSVADVKVNKIIVSVSSAGTVKGYEIINGTTIPNLVMYSGTNPATIILPGENSGLTYNATGFTSKIDSIQISPVIGTTQCGTSDSITEIENCALMT